ncbi:MAG TPA: YciI-like protein [Gemmataceae bacterium]|nr:YciI-like protein [Gemmataceae bacterium]
MKYYAVIYYLVDDYLMRRAAFREQHLRLAREAHGRGELLLAGALSDPADRALLVFRAPDSSVVEKFVASDPYVTQGLVTRWEIRPWNVVIGNEPSI